MGLVRIKVERGEIPQLTWMKREIHLVSDHQKTDWYGFLGVDLSARPGAYVAHVKILPSGLGRNLEIKISTKDYGVRRLTLPKGMVDLDTETLKRVRKESRMMKDLWKAPASTPRWSGPFLRPVPGPVVGPFGRRSIINNQNRAPHSGADLKAERGTPILAINNGKVVLTGDHFFSVVAVRQLSSEGRGRRARPRSARSTATCPTRPPIQRCARSSSGWRPRVPSRGSVRRARRSSTDPGWHRQR